MAGVIKKQAISWEVISSEAASVAENMKYDWDLFYFMEKGLINPTIRLYKWNKKGITHGYLQSDQQLPKYTMEIARRPTGGGIVFHDITEIAYCLVAPNNGLWLSKNLMSAYLQITTIIYQTLKEMGFPIRFANQDINKINKYNIGLKKKSYKYCFSQSEKHELVLGNKKIVGSAQRRTKKTIIQQGTIKTNILYDWKYRSPQPLGGQA